MRRRPLYRVPPHALYGAPLQHARSLLRDLKSLQAATLPLVGQVPLLCGLLPYRASTMSLLDLSHTSPCQDYLTHDCCGRRVGLPADTDRLVPPTAPEASITLLPILFRRSLNFPLRLKCPNTMMRHQQTMQRIVSGTWLIVHPLYTKTNTCSTKHPIMYSAGTNSLTLS